MRWINFSMVALLCIIPMLAKADDPPATPNYLTVGLVGNPLGVVPKLQVTFRNNATVPVGFALEVTANGEIVTQPDVSLHVQCVSNRPDWSCALDWWQNPDGGGPFLSGPDTTQAFWWDDAQFDTLYCFRVRIFTSDDPAADNWSKQACKQIPAKPPVPMAPIDVTDTLSPSAEQLAWRQPDFAVVAAFELEASETGANQWRHVESLVPINHGNESQQASVELSVRASQLLPLLLKDYRVCAANVSGRACSTAMRPEGSVGGPPAAKPLPSALVSEYAESDRHNAVAAAVSQPITDMALGRVRIDTASAPLPICDTARSAKARNSPAAPGLERQCLAGGGSMTPSPPVAAPDLDALAAVGVAIARQDPEVAEARNAEPGTFYQLGFDIASGIFGDPALGAKGNTLMGPGSEKIRNSLSAAGQRGFNDSVKFHQARNYQH